MSRVHDAPLAVSSDGVVFVNVTHAIGVTTPNKLLEAALKEPGQIFIGVSATSAETRRLRDHIRHGAAEAVAYAIGARKRKRRAR